MKTELDPSLVPQSRDFFADLIFNYLAAIVLVILFEGPATSLDRYFCGGPKQPTPSKLGDEKIGSVKIIEPEDHSTVRCKL